MTVERENRRNIASATRTALWHTTWWREILALALLATLAGPTLIRPHAAADEPTIARVQGTPRQVDSGKFRRTTGPLEREGTGPLERSGSYVKGVSRMVESYTADANAGGTAYVEVITYPMSYKYAMHDLLGHLLSKVSAPLGKKVEQRQLRSHANEETVRCRAWGQRSGDGAQIICDVQVEETDREDGVVGWLSVHQDGRPIAIRIGYRGLGGLPGQVIDELLAEYASASTDAIPSNADWETKDLEKWVELLRANKDDLRMLQAGAVYLTRYDNRSFGLLGALKQRDDAAAYSLALDGVVGRISQVVAERKKKARETGQRGE